MTCGKQSCHEQKQRFQTKVNANVKTERTMRKIGSDMHIHGNLMYCPISEGQFED